MNALAFDDLSFMAFTKTAFMKAVFVTFLRKYAL
jgi:hypothetical protein